MSISAEIAATLEVWPRAKIQLCQWHLHDAVKKRIKKAKLSTTPYNVDRAYCEYHFIDRSFLPYGTSDPNDGDDDDANDDSVDDNDPNPPENPNSVIIRIPSLSQKHTEKHTTEGTKLTERLMIRIPAQVQEQEPSFCPEEFHALVIELLDRHFCAHPLIPGYSAPSREGIKAWAVKQMYDFCKQNRLPNLWAYLWENWYRKGRWELWARTNHPNIPRLRTTMIVESQ